ncbi:MAG: ABC transporter permease [Acetobacteraceae bacterium]
MKAAAQAVARAWDGDVLYSFRHSPIAMVSAAVLLVLLVGAVFSSWLAPYDPFDLASLNLMDSFKPPAFAPEGDAAHLLGTDDQGRDVLSGIMYGAKISFFVGIASVLFAVAVGVSIGLLAGYIGGAADRALMRLADVQLSFPPILVALLVDGVLSVSLPRELHERMQIYVLIFAIGISFWPQFARTVRGSTLVERGKDYVMAARVIGLSPVRIMLTHILPNVLGPVLVIGTLTLGLAIISEATLSFLGVGLPPTQPSVGTLIRVGNDFLFSGEWWITVFPGVALILIVLSINLLGDWLRDALNPRLR